MYKKFLLNYYIHNIQVSVKCSHKKMRDFIDKSFFFFKKVQKYKFKIFIEIDFLTQQSFVNLSKKNIKIGNNALLNNNTLIFQDHGLIYIIKKKKNSIIVIVNKQKKEGIVSKSKNFLKNIFFNKDHYLILRQSIITPVIWFLSRMMNIHSLHGGAVSSNKKTIIISGLSGVGKTNLTLFMTLYNKLKFLSDNFLLFDNKFIYPFPEWIRLLDDSKKIMPELKNFLEKKTLKRNNKNYYMLSSNEISNKVKPTIFIFAEIGNNLKLKKIKTEYAVKRVLISKNQVKEFPEHNFISLLDLLCKKTSFFYEKEIKNLKKFLKKNSCYIFTLNKNLSVKKNIDFLIKKTL